MVASRLQIAIAVLRTIRSGHCSGRLVRLHDHRVQSAAYDRVPPKMAQIPRMMADAFHARHDAENLRQKLAGENVLRALERAEAVAAELQKTTAASTAQFEA